MPKLEDPVLEEDLDAKVLERMIAALVESPEGSDRVEALLEAVAYAYAATGKPLPSIPFIKGKIKTLAYKVVAEDLIERQLAATFVYVATPKGDVVAIATTNIEETAETFSAACDALADTKISVASPGEHWEN